VSGIRQRTEEDMPSHPSTFRVTLLSALAVLIGAGSLLMGINLAVSDYRYYQAAVPARATVLTFNREDGGNNNPGVVTAKIQYRSPDGKIVQADVKDFGDSDISAIGQSVAIRYLPEDPQHPRTEAGVKEWTSYYTLGSSAFFFLLLGYHSSRNAAKDEARRARAATASWLAAGNDRQAPLE
jgi:hypothetical protein